MSDQTVQPPPKNEVISPSALRVCVPLLGSEFRASGMRMLWAFVRGDFIAFTSDKCERIGFVRFSHRGLQPLDAVHIGDKQKRDVFHKRFELRFSRAFEQVVRNCAAMQREHQDGQPTWITEGVIQSYLDLHRLGFAYSAEAWEGDRLVGGLFGAHVGAFVNVASMYHHVPNASKAAYVRMLLHLRDRGFRYVDIEDAAPPHLARWGATNVPHWEFELKLRTMIRQPLTLTDDQRPVPLPWAIRLALPAARVSHGLLRRAATIGARLRRGQRASQ